jgi:Tol biopolymer transport system component
VRVITLRLKGETVGEFVNGPLVPGLTFGWSPAALGLIAFTDKGGKVVVMDQSGAKKEVPSTSDAVLPAWSDDGAKLAFLKKDGRRKYGLQVAKVDAGR